MLVGSIWIFIMWYFECRNCSSYMDGIKFDKYIVISNDRLARILISRNPDRNIYVNPSDYNKMTIMGIVIYLITCPLNLLQIIIVPLYSLDIYNCRLVATILFFMSAINFFIMAIIHILNLRGYKKKHKN